LFPLHLSDRRGVAISLRSFGNFWIEATVGAEPVIDVVGGEWIDIANRIF
jgi:hypothetical protein